MPSNQVGKIRFLSHVKNGFYSKIPVSLHHRSVSQRWDHLVQIMGSTLSKTESQNHRITESQNHRITEWWGLEGTSVGHPVQPPAEAGLPTVGCRGPCPGGSGISPEKEIFSVLPCCKDRNEVVGAYNWGWTPAVK